MTDTARMADIVLPATMFLEHADIYRPPPTPRSRSTSRSSSRFAECRANHCGDLRAGEAGWAPSIRASP